MENLKADELEIYKLLTKVGEGEEFEVGKLNNYAHANYNKYSNTINNVVNSARNSLYNLRLIDKSEEKLYGKYFLATEKYNILKNLYLFAIMLRILANIPYFRMVINFVNGMSFLSLSTVILVVLFPFICELLYYYKLQDGVKNNIAVLTDEGREEKAKWNGLVNYLKDFSNFKERTVPDLVLWEKYLVYATALGIGDTVIKQMKASYPEVFVKESWEQENINNVYPVIDLLINPVYNGFYDFNISESIGGSVESAYKTSLTEIARHSSSSSRRRTEASQAEAVGRRRTAGRNGRQIKLKKGKLKYEKKSNGWKLENEYAT